MLSELVKYAERMLRVYGDMQVYITLEASDPVSLATYLSVNSHVKGGMFFLVGDYDHVPDKKTGKFKVVE